MKDREISASFCRIFLCLVALFGLAQVEATAASYNNKSNSKKSSKIIKKKQARLWQKADELNLPARGQRSPSPEKYVVFRLNQTALSDLLAEMPLEFTDAARRQNVIMEVPMPDGSLARFRVEESPVLAPHLAADFPTWKTFQGYGIDDPTATARFDWTNSGFHGYVLSAGGTIYIDPFQENDTENYIVFYKHEFGGARPGNFHCKVEAQLSKIISPAVDDFSKQPFTNGANIRTYRIAVATTGEWARTFTMSTDPQTVRAAALAGLTTSVNRLDGIYRRELSVTLMLVNPPITDNMTNIIFDDPATDPYDNTDSIPQLGINQTTIDARVGTANYDVGHLYGTGGGGVASSPSVCSTQKAEGYSARGGIMGDPFTVDYAAHEIGHQFGANHTYNNADTAGTACTTRNAATSFEPASGSTIMSYVGICQNRNLQEFVETGTPSFHVNSLTEMITYIQPGGGGDACGTAAGTNAIPTVNAGANFTIPRLTPFTLTATGNDADATDVPNLLYSWEEFDNAASASGVLGVPTNTYDVDTDGVLRPLFRSYSPIAGASRTFPSLPFILNTANNNPAGSNNPTLTYQGTHPSGLPGATCAVMTDCVIGESLPSAARTMNFRATIRDGRGGTADAGMTVTTAAGTGPFQLTVQNALTELSPAVNWAANSPQTVTWDVAGTDANGINTANVNILLSTNGGQTFPITILANTPNDGTQAITVPNNQTTTARIKVEGVGNIFFDINNANFQILPPTAASVNVGGRVLSSDGRGVSRARVSLMGQTGAARTALTNSFGYYQIEGVEVGQTYVVDVRHKWFQFVPQSVVVFDNIGDLNFIAQP